MQPILVDGGELMTQRLVEIFDDFRVALHDALQTFLIDNRDMRREPDTSLERF
jgi:hypothetical protein